MIRAEQYANLVSDIVKQVELLKDQSQELKTLRELRLPMPMNGQVTVE